MFFLQLSGLTADQFIGGDSPSIYDKFRELLAKKLGYPSFENVEIVTLRDGDGYLEVRYSAHGSPYLSSAQVDNAVILHKEEVLMYFCQQEKKIPMKIGLSQY